MSSRWYVKVTFEGTYDADSEGEAIRILASKVRQTMTTFDINKFQQDVKANRKIQSRFLCISCGFAGSADTIAARNISSRAFGDMPNATSFRELQVPC